MMNNGTLAVAVVQSKVMVVQGMHYINSQTRPHVLTILITAARSHSRRDRFLEVYTYTPFGDRVFLATNVPSARIMLSDILAIFPASDKCRSTTPGMLELPQKAFSEFLDLSSRNQKRHESLWNAWATAH